MASRSPQDTKQADEDLKRLRREYDRKKGGYNIEVDDTSDDVGTRLSSTVGGEETKKKKTIFIKSDLTPEEGGYYADKSHLNDPVADTSSDASLTSSFPGRSQKEAPPSYKYFDEKRTSAITGAEFSEFDPEGDSVSIFKTDVGAVKRDLAASARKPYKRVNRSLRQQRQSKRRQRAVARGRQSTVLTGTLGTTEDDKKKTLLS